MTNIDYLIEVSILSTVLFAHHSCNDEEYFNNLELQEEWFLVPFHKLVVKTINHNKMMSIPIYEEFIADAIQNNNALDFQLWLTIVSANPFSKHSFDEYLKILKKPNLSLSCDV